MTDYHWFLCVIKKFSNNDEMWRVSFLDSMTQKNKVYEREYNKIVNFMIKRNKSSSGDHLSVKDFKHVAYERRENEKFDVPQQPNTFDCGLYTCIFAEHVIQNSESIDIKMDSDSLRDKFLYRTLFNQISIFN